MKKVLIGVATIVLVVSGCGIHAVKTSDFSGLSNTSVYIAQPGDLTHGGQKVEGSGTLFLSYLKTHLFNLSGANINVFTADNTTRDSADADISNILNKANELNTHFALIIKLGEMRDAAPMTFRSDYVSIEEGALYRVSDKKEVWRAYPKKIEGANVPKYNRLLDELAKMVASSIASR